MGHWSVASVKYHVSCGCLPDAMAQSTTRARDDTDDASYQYQKCHNADCNDCYESVQKTNNNSSVIHRVAKPLFNAGVIHCSSYISVPL